LDIDTERIRGRSQLGCRRRWHGQLHPNHGRRLLANRGRRSYQGISDSGDLLQVWSRKMSEIELHDAFVPIGTALPERRRRHAQMWSTVDDLDSVSTTGVGRSLNHPA
jgi:hypothetical protein